MTPKYQPIWILGNYQRFLQHPDPLARHWAADRIEEQYPQQAAASFVGLLTDPDTHLQITAARAIGDSSDPRYEPALLVVWPASQGFVRNWFTTTLGQLRSPSLLPHLLADVAAAPAHCPPETQMLAVRSVVEALGYYSDEAARSALWQFVERYREDDRLSYTAFQGLLRWADPATLPRLVQRYGHLKRRDETWWHAILALAEIAGVDRLTQELIGMIPGDPDEVFILLDDWLQQDTVYSEGFEDAVYEAASRTYAGLLPHILAELERLATERGDNLPAWLEEWQTRGRPTGYRWRMLYAHQFVAALVEYPPPQPKQYQAAVALSLAVLAQAFTDQDDEAMLQAAPNELIRQAALLNILGSPRMNVLPDVVNQVVALGPGVVPHLPEILTGDHFWALPRTLDALTRLARAHPGTAEAAVSAILDLIHEEQSDYVLEPAGEALVAIGPAVITPAAARLGQVDDVYDIYVSYALGNIPTTASAEALLSYIDEKRLLEEHEAEALADLGHPKAIPFLKDYYQPGDPLLGTVLYTLALLNDYTGPELVEWRAIALDYYADLNRPQADPIPKPQPAASQGQNKVVAEKKRQKQRRLQAKAQRLQQQKRSKKKKKRR